ncbi:MAG: 2-aminobenzoate-CoA ligase [Betaproteobacteria bacterium]|nr:2-aminobenzoate-CoA ligase [Betaproteobacteria bacterium]
MTTAHPSSPPDTFARDRLPPAKQWPELRFDLPELQYPARLNAAAELLDRAVAEGDGRRPAIWMPVDGQPMVATYAQLQHRVNRIAQVLVEDFGLVPGNRVLLRGPNNAMMAACWLAVIKAGLIAVATMPLLRAKELKQMIDKAQITHALCSQPLWQEIATCTNPNSEHYAPTLKRIGYFDDGEGGSIEELVSFKSGEFTAVDTAADDVALIAFTSGTTGEPKGTVHFHRDIIAMCDCFPRSCLKPTKTDIFCGTPPIAFTFGLGGMLAFPMRARASTVLVEKLSPDLLLQTIARFKATICFTAPTFYRQMAMLASKENPQHNPQYKLASLKKCVSAGEALPDATRQQFKAATGIEIIDGIGATEMMHIFISHTPQTVRRGATGKPIPGYQAQVQDANGKECPPGTVGKLAVKGPTGCRYLDDPRQASYVRKGWNLTGDAYMMDADGYFFYQARTDDMIISAGYNIAGPEVESCLLTHEAVAECGVIGLADEERGQIVKAFVVLKAGYYGNQAMTKTLQDYVKKAVAPYKYPRKIEYVESLPRTETGKLQRFRLRQQAAA